MVVWKTKKGGSNCNKAARASKDASFPCRFLRYCLLYGVVRLCMAALWLFSLVRLSSGLQTLANVPPIQPLPQRSPPFFPHAPYLNPRTHRQTKGLSY